MDSKIIGTWLQEVLASHGYRRKNNIYWIKETEDCQLIIYLQTADPNCYINMGIYIRCLGSTSGFKSFKSGWHVGRRADSELRDLLDPSKLRDLKQQEVDFKAIVKSNLIPQLDSMGTIEQIRTALRSGTDFRPLGSSTLRFFNIPLGPRHFYGGGGTVHTQDRNQHPSKTIMGSQLPDFYLLFKRDSVTGTAKLVNTVHSLDMAEAWIKSWFRDITRDEAADILHRYIREETEGNEFQYLLSELIEHDEIIRSARDKLLKIPKKSLQFRDQNAIKCVQNIEKLLRAGHRAGN
jgi:hypothetical protein